MRISVVCLFCEANHGGGPIANGDDCATARVMPTRRSACPGDRPCPVSGQSMASGSTQKGHDPKIVISIAVPRRWAYRSITGRDAWKSVATPTGKRYRTATPWILQSRSIAVAADTRHKAVPHAPGLPRGHVRDLSAAVPLVRETPSHPTAPRQINSGVDESRLSWMDDLPLAWP